MISTVTKRDGSVVPFDVDKFNRWAEYASEVGGNWSEIAVATYKRLSEGCSTQDIHQTMIDVCIDKESIEYSRVASRLEFASIRKNMQYVFGIDDRSPIKDILQAYEDFDVWDSDYIPVYNPVWENWYNEIKQTRLEYWQVKQWTDKYACKVKDVVIETPHLGYFGIALAIYGDTDKAFKFMKALVKGKINLPTPALNGLRNGDWDTISCCVISAKDTTESIGVANHVAYRMTAKKAGIGIEFTTRSKHDKVKGGRVEHLGLAPIYRAVNAEVKTLTQITRGGNATVTVQCINPEVMDVMMWKSPLTDVEQRIDKLDYSFAYNDAFAEAVIADEDWYLFSLADAPEVYNNFYTASKDEYNSVVAKAVKKGVKHKKVKARDLLKKYLTIRQESGRFYDINVTRANTHTPFIDTIRQSNLCMEIQLPTKGYNSMDELYSSKSKEGEVAFCSLSGINVARISDEEYEEIAELTLEAIDIMIERAPMMTKSMRADILRRRSVGVGILGLAVDLYNNNLDYNGSSESLARVRYVAERHYYYLLKASQKLAKESGISVTGIKKDWLPIDTSINKQTSFDWESLRGLPRKHSVLTACMPTESSSLLSGVPNSVYPPRERLVYKKARKGVVQFICQEMIEGKHITAWDIDNINMSKYYGEIQDFTDQAISADGWCDPEKYSDGKVPMSVLMKEFIAHYKLGNKTRYYINTKPKRATTLHSDVEEPTDDCESCKL